MNDIELPECASFRLLVLVVTPKFERKPYVQSVVKQASQRGGSLFRVRDTLNLRPFCTPSTYVWSTAPIFGVVLHNRVALICLIRLVNLIGPVLTSTLQHLTEEL